jgi:succinate dehydrogenase / fumarate reductase membrane anchor subunit
MATTISHKTTSRQVRVKANLERLGYMFMRMSGIALLILAVGHVTIQLILNDVHSLSLQFVADQWDDWGWKAYDMLLLVFALSHGLNGLRNILEDYIHNRTTVRVINSALAVFLVVTIIAAGFAIASFDADAIRALATGS